jgi:hypothetical protein
MAGRDPAAYQNDRQDPRTKISSLGRFRVWFNLVGRTGRASRQRGEGQLSLGLDGFEPVRRYAAELSVDDQDGRLRAAGGSGADGGRRRAGWAVGV